MNQILIKHIIARSEGYDIFSDLVYQGLISESFRVPIFQIISRLGISLSISKDVGQSYCKVNGNQSFIVLKEDQSDRMKRFEAAALLGFIIKQYKFGKNVKFKFTPDSLLNWFALDLLIPAYMVNVIVASGKTLNLVDYFDVEPTLIKLRLESLGYSV